MSNIKDIIIVLTYLQSPSKYFSNNNLYDILGIELLTACQALEFRRPAKSSEVIESIFHDFRELVPILEGDRMLYKDIHQAADYIRNNRKA